MSVVLCDRALVDADARVAQRQARLTGVATARLPENALSDAVKAYNYFRGVWKARKDSCVDAADVIRCVCGMCCLGGR